MITDLPEFETRAADFNGELIHGQARIKIAAGAQLAIGADADAINNAVDAGELKGDVASLSVGLPISGYRVQASRTRDFEKMLMNKVFEAEERVTLNDQKLPAGVYWFRIALIDLLGTEDAFSAPRLYSVGLGAKVNESVDLKNSIVLVKPAADEDVWGDSYKVVGLIKHDNLTVSVNGKQVRQDENGNFSLEVKMRSGVNEINVTVTDPSGNSTSIVRRLTYTSRY
jgi:hypothetical protein